MKRERRFVAVRGVWSFRKGLGGRREQKKGARVGNEEEGRERKEFLLGDGCGGCSAIARFE